MNVHTYILPDKLALRTMYDHIRDGITRERQPIMREIRTNSSGDFFETETDKFVFLRAVDGATMRGRRTHYLYIDKKLRSDEQLVSLCIMPMLMQGNGLPPSKERVFWI